MRYLNSRLNDVRFSQAATIRKSYNDLNVTPTLDLEKNTHRSLHLNEKQIYMFHSVSETAHTKKISLVDFHNAEKRSNETESCKQSLFLFTFSKVNLDIFSSWNEYDPLFTNN